MALKSDRLVYTTEIVSLYLKPRQRGGMIMVNGIPKGILLQDIVSFPPSVYKDEVETKAGIATVTLLKRGWVVTNCIDKKRDIQSWMPAYVRGDGILSPVGKIRVGHFMSSRFDGYARVYIEVN